MKLCLTILSVLFLITGLVLLIWDACYFYQHDFHYNEVASTTPDGEPIDWPTGEIPLLMQIPIASYAVMFCFAGGLTFGLKFLVQKPFKGRVCRGTE